jgi:hypothetical protein
MTTFIAVYRGRTIGESKLVAVTADPSIVGSIVEKILDMPDAPATNAEDDPALEALQQGKRQALRIIRGGKTLAS